MQMRECYFSPNGAELAVAASSTIFAYQLNGLEELMQRKIKKALRTLTIKPLPIASPLIGTPLHPGVGCDLCNCCPLVGTRFRSMARPEYDVCGSCRITRAAEAASAEPYEEILPPPRETGAGDQSDVSLAVEPYGSFTAEVRLPAGSGTVRCVAASTCGSLIATGGSDNRVMVYDAATGALRVKLIGHDYSVTHVAFSPSDPDLIASTAMDDSLKFW